MKRRLGLVLTLLGIALLCGLGFWQLQRQTWKDALLAEIRNQMQAAPLDLNQLPEGRPFPDLNYRRVQITGEFLHDHEFHLLSRTHEGKVGAEIVTLFHQTNGGFWLINRGWVPDDRIDPQTRAESQMTGPLTVSGIARRPAPRGWMQPANSPARNQWFFLDPAAMFAAAGIQAAPLSWIIDADLTPNPGGLPIGGVTVLDIPNNHRQYALTWFALAAVLAVFLLLKRLPD